MAIKVITGTPAIAPPITAGKIPYADGTNALRYLPIGAAGQVLAVNNAVTAPEWRYSGKVLLASYSGSADVFLTNIPQYYRELRIIIGSGGSLTSVNLRSFTASNGGTFTGKSSAYYAINATPTTANGATASSGSLTHPRTGPMAYNGGAVNTVEIVMPEYSGSTFGGSSITSDRVIYHVMMTPPGGSLNVHGMGCAVTYYDVSAANVGITGFTISLGSITSRVWVYAS